MKCSTTFTPASTYLVEFAWSKEQLTLFSEALLHEEQRLHDLSDQTSRLCDKSVYDSLLEKRIQLERVARKLISCAAELGHC